MGIVGAGFISGIEDLGDRLVASQHRLPIQQHDGHRGDRKHVVLPGLGVGPGRAVHLKVEQGGDQEATRAALNIGVTRTERASTPITKGPKDQALCSVPLSRKAGKCRASRPTRAQRPLSGASPDRDDAPLSSA